MTPYIQDADLTICPCGCGERFSPIGSRGRTRTYFSPGCSLRANNYVKLTRGETAPAPRAEIQTTLLNPFYGRRHSDATRATLSAKASVPKPYLRGEKNGMSGRTGSSNPNWRGGGSPERQRMYASGEWRRLRRKVYARAGGICERCGSTELLHMHHVKPWAEYPEFRLTIENIELLCRPCHIDEHRKGGVRHQ